MGTISRTGQFQYLQSDSAADVSDDVDDFQVDRASDNSPILYNYTTRTWDLGKGSSRRFSCLQGSVNVKHPRGLLEGIHSIVFPCTLKFYLASMMLRRILFSMESHLEYGSPIFLTNVDAAFSQAMTTARTLLDDDGRRVPGLPLFLKPNSPGLSEPALTLSRFRGLFGPRI
jgi:hypothetical protein